jgi:hypothetical protein
MAMTADEMTLLETLYVDSKMNPHGGSSVASIKEKLGANFPSAHSALMRRGFIAERGPVGSVMLSDAGWREADRLFD